MSQKFVLLPGFLCDPRLWNDFQQALPSDLGTFIALDFKDCKDINQMLQLIGNVPDKTFHLVGFSMGGYMAQKFAVQFPDRIQSLSLIAANVGALNERERAARLKMADTLSQFHYRGMSPKEVERYVHPVSMANAHIVETIVSMSATYSSEMYIHQMKATLDRDDLSMDLNKLSFPVLMVGAENDRVVPAQTLADMKKRIARAHLEIISECGHYIPLEKPNPLALVFNKFMENFTPNR